LKNSELRRSKNQSGRKLEKEEVHWTGRTSTTKPLQPRSTGTNGTTGHVHEKRTTSVPRKARTQMYETCTKQSVIGRIMAAARGWTRALACRKIFCRRNWVDKTLTFSFSFIRRNSWRKSFIFSREGAPAIRAACESESPVVAWFSGFAPSPGARSRSMRLIFPATGLPYRARHHHD
jgi:hypothetical protein